MNFVIGARGRLGRALTSALPAQTTIALDRSIYAGWTRPGAADDVAAFFSAFPGEEHVVYIAAGVTDPKRAAEDHIQVNLVLPQNVIAGVSRRGGRVVTFGTIMEEVVGRHTANPYFDSKLRLADYIEDASRAANVLHVRIHTLYGGGAPNRFMFLGQLLDAIRQNAVFRMSDGSQLREYHHVEDEVAAIALLAGSGITGAIGLSHGAPIRLRDLAQHVCAHFGCLDRLEIGAIPSPASDNFDRVFLRPPILRDLVFRDTLPAVVEDLKSHDTAFK